MIGNKTLYIGDGPYKFLSKAKIGGIPIFDLLPGVKKRYLTTTTKIYLDRTFNSTCFTFEDSYQELMVTHPSVPKLIAEDERVVRECLSLVKNLSLIKKVKEDYTIYDLIEVSYLLCSGIMGDRCYTLTEFRRFKSIVIDLPHVNPLLCSVLLRDQGFIDTYLNNRRSNKSEACIRSVGNPTMFHKIFSTISVKIFLCGELFLNIQDVYKYILSMRVF